MKTVLGALCLALVLGSVPAVAQTPVPSPTPPATKLSWDHDGINTDGYRLKIDDVTSVVVATCAVVNAVRTCDTPFPALTPGTHTLWVIAFNAAGEASSDPFLVSVFVQPTKPTGIRIIQK